MDRPIEVSDVQALRGILDDLSPDGEIAGFVLTLACLEDIWSDRQGAYESLRPAAEGSPIAIFIFRDRLEICLEPHRAKICSSSLQGSSVREVSAATGQWVIPAALISDNHDKILAGAREAIKWRRDGVRFSQPGKET